MASLEAARMPHRLEPHLELLADANRSDLLRRGNHALAVRSAAAAKQSYALKLAK